MSPPTPWPPNKHRLGGACWPCASCGGSWGWKPSWTSSQAARRGARRGWPAGALAAARIRLRPSWSGAGCRPGATTKSAAAAAVRECEGQRYFGWAYEAGRFRYFEDPQKLPHEKALEGKYWIQSEEQNLTPVEAVSRYKELMAVERAFRDLKDVIEMRPIYHQTPRRVEAHIFVAALALLLQHAVQRKLKQAGLDLSAEEALGR